MILRKSPGYPFVFINATSAELPAPIIRTLDLETSYLVQNPDRVIAARRAKLIKQGITPEPWDGRIRLLKQSKQGNYYFPIGMLDSVLKVLEWYGITPTLDLNFNETEQVVPIDWSGPALRDYQVDAFIRAKSSERCITQLPTGSGKCHGKGTKILMYNGTIKNVEDIQIGDKLMGADSTPRTVLSLAHGVDQMYKIIPIKGEPWTCNGDHILSLKITSDEPPWKKNQLINISVNEYFKQCNWFKHITKLWRTGVSFPHHSVEYDPYILGVWLGDGTKIHTAITNSDKEIIEKIKEYATKNGLLIRETYKNNTTTHHISRGLDCEQQTFGELYSNGRKENVVLTMIRKCVINGEKRIPHRYLVNSESTRYLLLAGLLDADGYLHNNVYEIITKYEGLKDDILYLVRSLGLRATVSDKVGRIKSLKFEGKYYRIVISGDVHKIPCLVPRKIATVRKQKKDVLKTGFSIEPLGVGEYYGFELDGDGLYLLWDFTVTHNTVLALKLITSLKKPTLIVVHTKELFNQWVGNFEKHTTITPTKFNDKVKEFGLITVAMVQSLDKWLQKKGNKLPAFDVLVLDEAHHTPANTFYTVSMKCDARYRFGLTATTKREDGTDMLMVAGLGAIVTQIKPEELVKNGSLSLPKFEFLSIPPTMIYGNTYAEVYKSGIVLNTERNALIIRRAKQLSNEGRQVYIHVEHIMHGKLLADISGFPFVYSSTKDRDTIIDGFRSGDTRVLISTLLGEGVDIPNISAIIMAGGRKTEIGTIQKVGRALRPSAQSDAIVVDFLDKGKYLSTHALNRYQAYVKFFGNYVLESVKK